MPTLVHKSYQVSTSTNDDNYAVTFETLYDSIFVVFSKQTKLIYRIGGDTVDNLSATLFYTMSSGPMVLGKINND